MNQKEFFAQPEVQKAFENYNISERIRLVKVACWVGILAMPLGSFLDMIDYPTHVRYFLELRLACSVGSLLILGLVYTRLGQRYHLLLTLILAIMTQGFISWLIYASEGAVSPYYAILNLPLLIYVLLFPWTYLMTFTLSVATVGFYLIACFAHGGATTSNIFYSNLILMMYTVSFAILGTYFTNQLRIREFTSRYELDQSRRELEDSNRKLKELDEAKTRFFSNVSHELRTPLTLLISPIQSLKKEKGHLFDEEMNSTFQIMEGNAFRLLKLVNDLLDLAKLQTGSMNVKREPLRLPEFIRGMALSAQGSAKDKKITLSSSVGEGLQNVVADRDKLEKIILNLVFNAIKFTPAGGRIDLSAVEEGTWLAVNVKDTGIGISKENISRIFDRFFQVDTSAQRKYQGTGLGLSLVKELSEVQGGSVTVESELGKGTNMIVRIPLEKTEEQPPEPSTMATSGEAPAQSPEWLEKLYRRAELFSGIAPASSSLRPDALGLGKRPKVLVADDEPDMLAFLRSQLEKHYDVLEAVDGNQAVEKARQFMPDLVVMDMMMPEKDGVTACREIKAATATQSIPVVLLTARADEQTKMDSLAAGASDFLTKPFSTTELHVRVKNLIDSYEYQRGLANEKKIVESANEHLKETLDILKETEGKLVQSEKMAGLGTLAAGIMHEVLNPLNFAKQASHILKRKKDSLPENERDKFSEAVLDIEDGLNRVQRIVEDLRGFTTPQSARKDLVGLSSIIQMSLRFLSHELGDAIAVDNQVPPDQEVFVDKNKISQVFINLVKNSADAMKKKSFNGEKPAIVIRSKTAGEKTVVTVWDNGPGIKQEVIHKIFEPFFTTKDVGEGMGLGLSICYRIIKDEGGDISVNSEPGKFTEFNIELPTQATFRSS